MQKSAGTSDRGTCAFFVYNQKLALRVLSTPFRPALFHSFGDTLPALGAQLTLARSRSRRSCIFTAFGSASTTCRRPSQKCPCLLQLQYLSVNLSNNTTYFHVLPPVGYGWDDLLGGCPSSRMLKRLPYDDTKGTSHSANNNQINFYFSRIDVAVFSSALATGGLASTAYPGPTSSSSSKRRLPRP
jgi:hypothetical protein